MKTNFLKNNIWVGLLISVFILSCGNKGPLSEKSAKSAVETYLKTNPIYETTNIAIGEIKFNVRKDSERLKLYKDLESKGYVSMELEKQKKKLLSKDSIFTYNIKLTDKAAPYIFKQRKEKAEVKSFEYQLNDQEEIKLQLTGKKSGIVVVSLKKIQTDFAPFATDNNPHTTFITKTFKLKNDKEEGWKVLK